MSNKFAKLAYFCIQIVCTHVSILYPLQVVRRGSETQLQEGFNSLI